MLHKIEFILKYFIKHPAQMKLLLIFTFIIYGMLISFISYSLTHHYQAGSTKIKLMEDQRQSFNIKSNHLKEKMNGFENALESFNSSEIFKRYIDLGTENENIRDLFSVIMNDNKELSQLRFIDKDGNEKIRFDRNELGEKSFEVLGENLQNKKTRYYFKEIKYSPKNKTWYSKLDLNIERGEIQMPIVPTLRVGKAVYNKKGFQGILIMNIFFKDILEKYVQSPFFYISIYDKDGEFIYHKHLTKDGKLKDYSWSKYLKKDFNFNMHKKNLKTVLLDVNANDYIFEKSIHHIIPNADDLSVHYEPKLKELKEFEENDQNYIFTVTIIVLLLSLPLSFIISMLPSMLNDELFKMKKNLDEQMKIVDEHVYLSTTDKNGKILNISQAYLDLLGYKKEDLVGKTHAILKPTDTDKTIYEDLWATILSKKIWQGEISNLKKNGEKFEAKVLIKPNFDDKGKISTFTSYIQDITYQKEVEKLSVTDELTKLFNRREFNRVLDTYISQSKRYKYPFSMIIFDIDFFKQYNDTYGHQMGDEALKNVAKEITFVLKRSTDLGFRIGGEEFSILFSTKSLADSKKFAEKIRKRIEALNIEHKNSAISKYLTISIGLFYSEDISTLNKDEIFDVTDKALYKAKQAGRNQISVVKV
ncbi:MAG: hypothetical protein C0625_06115 [Arcobacter sp.]|nr:MAG: hypothetical protein C0625_06115 [Arcobacter sp.]